MVKDMRGLSIRRLTEEHGIVDIKRPAAAVEVGDKIEIWVPYSDATVNLHDRMCRIRDGQVEEIFRAEG
jgi:D-serine deaminase-like pyridoxal phosphate-dependent protein